MLKPIRVNTFSHVLVRHTTYQNLPKRYNAHVFWYVLLCLENISTWLGLECNVFEQLIFRTLVLARRTLPDIIPAARGNLRRTRRARHPPRRLHNCNQAASQTRATPRATSSLSEQIATAAIRRIPALATGYCTASLCLGRPLAVGGVLLPHRDSPPGSW